MYHANVVLILVETLTCHDEHVSFRKLDLLFDALVFMYGLDDLINISNVDKFKKDIKVCIQISILIFVVVNFIFAWIEFAFFAIVVLKIAFPLIDSILKDEHFDLFGGYITNCFDLIMIKDVELFKVRH